MKNLEQQLTFTPEPILHSEGIASSTSINNLLSDPSNIKCSMGNQGFLTCINYDCTNTDPFICLTKSCKCFQLHKDCDQKRIDSLQESLNQKFLRNSQKQQLVAAKIDTLNDIFSNFSDQLIEKLKPSEDPKSLNQQINPQFIQINRLKEQIDKKSLTGGTIHRIFNSSKLKIQKKNHDVLMKDLKKRFKDFEQKQVRQFLHSIEKMLIRSGPNEKLTFSSQFIHENLQMLKDTQIKANQDQKGAILIALINPPLSKIHQTPKLHKWKMRVSVKRDFRIGVIKASYAKKVEYEVQNLTTKQKTYMIYRWKDFSLFNGTRPSKSALKKGDLFEVEYNQKSNKVSIRHENSKANLEIDLSGWIGVIGDDSKETVHLMVGLGDQGDRVQIVNLKESASDKEETRKLQSASDEYEDSKGKYISYFNGFQGGKQQFQFPIKKLKSHRRDSTPDSETSSASKSSTIKSDVTDSRQKNYRESSRSYSSG